MRNKEFMSKDPEIDGEFLTDLGCLNWMGICQEPRPPQLHLGERAGLFPDLSPDSVDCCPLPFSPPTSLSFPAL